MLRSLYVILFGEYDFMFFLFVGFGGLFFFFMIVGLE